MVLCLLHQHEALLGCMHAHTDMAGLITRLCQVTFKGQHACLGERGKIQIGVHKQPHSETDIHGAEHLELRLLRHIPEGLSIISLQTEPAETDFQPMPRRTSPRCHIQVCLLNDARILLSWRE